MSKQTSSKESAVRKKVDQKLVELGWIIDEDNPDCNVFTERAKTEEQNKKFLGNEPDYVLYESKTDRPIAIIETKRKGADLEKALKYAKNKYAKPLNINLVFATDSVFVKTHHLEENEELTINDEPIVDLISEPDMLKFAEDCFLIDNKLKKLDYTKDELIKIYKLSNDLLREDGLREGAERFTEFANILFLKYLSEMEEKNVKDGKGAKIDKNKRWDSIRAKHEDDVIDFINDTVFPHISKKYSDGENIFENKLLIKNGSILKKIINKLSEINLLDAESDVGGDAFEYFLDICGNTVSFIKSITSSSCFARMLSQRLFLSIFAPLPSFTFFSSISDKYFKNNILANSVKRSAPSRNPSSRKRSLDNL